MAWLVLHLESDRADSDRAEQALLTLGAAAVTLQGRGDQALFEVLPGDAPLWEAVRVSGLFDAATDIAEVEAALARDPDLGHCRRRLEILEDKDWVRTWMEDYRPIPIGDRLWICPSWITPPDPAAINLILDPGLAFGTGTHPTTAMCLEWMDRHPPDGLEVIDFGCGSGILAIAALLLGARSALGTDIDPVALVAARENAERNGRADELQLLLPDQLPCGLQADIVLANILAGPLIELAPVLSALVAPGGRLVLSGLLVEQVAAVRAAYPDLRFAPASYNDEWAMLTGFRQIGDTDL